MKVYIYSIRDIVADVYNKPFQDLNNASAIRSFKEACTEQPHKDDYELWLIAEFDNTNGLITDMQLDQGIEQVYPVRLMTGRDVKVADIKKLKEA